MKFRLTILCLVALISCGQKPYQKNVDKLFKGPLFRNHQLGDSYSSVMKSEEEKFMLFPDSNMIKYHCMVADTEEYHWAYVFTKDKLSQIHFEAFLGSIKNGDDYVAAIKNKYDNHLGPSTSFNLGYRWLTDSVSAIVFNESEEANMGYVRMVFFNTKDSTNTDTLK